MGARCLDLVGLIGVEERDSGEHRTGASPLVAPALGEVPRHRDMGRCRASRLAGRTLQKQTLNLNLRRWIAQDVLFESALEGLSAADQAYQEQ